jgi:6-phosphogluconolactonase (cycloisomerase 2 family)/uncharacterized protein YjdB
MNRFNAIRFSTTWVPGLKSTAAALLLGLTGFIAGCGGSGVSVTSASSGLPTLSSIGVTPSAPGIVQGTTQQFTATGVYSDNSKQDITSTVTWTSATTSVATISNAVSTIGLASAVGGGSSTITATLGGVSGSTTLTVTAATLVSIAVTPANPSIAKGLPEQFTATGTYSNNSTQDLTSTVTWTSSNPSIAAFSTTAGVATAVAPGSATITASMGSVSGTTTLTVTAAAVVSIAVAPATPSIANGTQQQFTATGTYTDATTQLITTMASWSPSAPAVASVGAATGLAKGLSVGSTTITATLNGVSGSTTLAVTAATLVSIAVTPASPVILNGSSGQLTATGTYTDATTQVLTTTATWASATTTIATISNAAGSSGLATGLSLGTSSITAASGGVTSPAVTLTVKPSEYAYVANFGGNTISQYNVGTGGVLTPMATATVAAGTQPYSIAVDPSGHYVYAANYNASGAGTVSQYTIGANGSLTPNIAGAVSTSGLGPNGITVDPSGTHAYVANFGSNPAGNGASLAQFTITNGALTAMTPATLPAANGASSVALNPASTYAYVPNYVADSISVFTITGGALTSASTTTVTAGSGPSFGLVVVDLGGQYLYVTEQADKGTPGVGGGIAQFTIGANGALTPMSTPVIAVSGNPRSLTLDPTGTYVYLANGTDSILQFSIGAGGALSLVSTTTVGANSAPNFLAVDPTGQYAYVGDRGTLAIPGSTVSQYTIGAASALVPASPATVASGSTAASRPSGIATSAAY